MMLRDQKLCVLNGGGPTAIIFLLGTGVRQGNAVSAFLFTPETATRGVL